jgi:hypothetical protein
MMRIERSLEETTKDYNRAQKNLNSTDKILLEVQQQLEIKCQEINRMRNEREEMVTECENKVKFRKFTSFTH